MNKCLAAKGLPAMRARMTLSESPTLSPFLQGAYYMIDAYEAKLRARDKKAKGQNNYERVSSGSFYPYLTFAHVPY